MITPLTNQPHRLRGRPPRKRRHCPPVQGYGILTPADRARLERNLGLGPDPSRCRQERTAVPAAVAPAFVTTSTGSLEPPPLLLALSVNRLGGVDSTALSGPVFATAASSRPWTGKEQ